jgi:glycerol uptake facilitator-like aquaporin
VPAFILAQLLGACAAIAAIRALYPDVTARDAAEVIVPHGDALRDSGSVDEPVAR